MNNLYSEESLKSNLPPKRLILIIGIAISLLILFTSAGQLLNVWLNIQEFGDLYIRPIYYGFIGGLLLASITVVRTDFKNRRSLTWWIIKTASQIPKARDNVEDIQINIPNFNQIKLKPFTFIAWQITKVIIATSLFINVNLGMAIVALTRGWDSGLSQVPQIFMLPFTNPSFDMLYAQTKVIPMIPALTLIVIPILGAIGTRLLVLYAITKILSQKPGDRPIFDEETRKLNLPTSTIEHLISVGLLWTGFNLFFPSYIDYNTKFIIGGVFAAGIVFSFLSYLDNPDRKKIFKPPGKPTQLRIASVLIIFLLVGSAIAVQGSIADARRIEWNGPYTTQEIATNRYLANLDVVNEITYNFSLSPLSLSEIDPYIEQNKEILDKIRLFDLKAADAKLRPEIGLIPYVDFQDTDILRFNDTLYWSASLKPILPSTVETSNVWYAEHLVYTHVPNGYLLLNGHDGTIVNTSLFFDQRKIYYGEGGLFSDVWSAYPTDRTTSDELNGFLYNGLGGVDIPPPLSWIFEPNFLFSRPSDTIHAMRYRDVYDRLDLLFPYFVYSINNKPIDMYPVTDGKQTYWLMPLITAIDSNRVPWSDGNPFVRFNGYALIDTYNGNMEVFILGNDFYSNLFKSLYSDYVQTEIPEWLEDQTRYPEELFEYRVEMYNFYHITNPGTFIEAREFFEIPPNLDTYFIMSNPPTITEEEFIGLLSLQLRGSPGQNLAGYMTLRNDYEHLGEMIFYEVPLDSDIKLLGPTAILEALERNPEFKTLRTLLRDPRVGDNILYRIGDHDIYFIPVYTAGAGGVVTQLATIAAIGATFTGEYYMGFGDTPEEAYKQFLIELSGVSVAKELKPSSEVPIGSQIDFNIQVIEILTNKGINIVEPDEIPSLFKFKEYDFNLYSNDDESNSNFNNFVNEWIENYQVTRIYRWEDEETINYGAVINLGAQNVPELHYISINK